MVEKPGGNARRKYRRKCNEKVQRGTVRKVGNAGRKWRRNTRGNVGRKTREEMQD